MKRLILLYLLFILSLDVFAGRRAVFDFDEFQCTIYNTEPRQGDMVFIKVTPRQGIIPQKIRIDNERELFFLPFGVHYISVFGSDFRENPGVLPVTIYYACEGMSLSEEIKLEYLGRTFDVWTLPATIPRARTQTPEEIEKRKKEVESISNALRPVTPKLYILDGYTKPIKDSRLEEYRAFGQKRIRNNVEVSRHKGVDISRPRGTPVYSPLSGQVALIGHDFFFEGNILIIDNGLGIFSIFCHLDRFAVNKGDIVAVGDIIGYVGSTGRSTGPHLHWQVKFLYKDINPLSFSFLNDLIEEINI